MHGVRGAGQGGGQLQSRVRTQKGEQGSRRALLQGRGQLQGGCVGARGAVQSGVQHKGWGRETRGC